MQSFTEKCEALKTLLPLIYVHLGRMPMARSTRRYGQALEREKDPGYMPPPGWSLLDCDGRCFACEYEDDCRGEWWWVEMVRLEKQYRIQTVKAAWTKLNLAAPQLAAAVAAEYLETKDEKDRTLIVVYARKDGRAGWAVDSRTSERHAIRAEAGIKWMARNIRGDLTPFHEKPKTTEEKVLEEMASGCRSSFIIACRLGVSTRRVQQIRAALRAR